jgi:glycerophosphoryl diester phosphodiesterase
MRINLLLALVLLFASCTQQKEMKTEIDWQGHRGARGNYPENTWPAFKFAMDNQMNTLEMDVVISKDSQVIISHEPFLNHLICKDTAGNAIAEEDEKKWNLYEMTYEEIAQCDCGSLGNPNFPDQDKMKVAKPLLKDVLDQVKNYAKAQGMELPYLNVEIKYVGGNQGVFHPEIPLFSRLVYEVLSVNYPKDKWNIQSFDFDVLKYWNKEYPKVPLAAFVESSTDIDSQFNYLGFTPAIYSPYHIIIDQATIDRLHEKGVKVIPWTVNKEKIAERLIEMGVDGIITDYPKMASKFRDNQ